MKLKTAGLLLIKERKLLMAYSSNKACFYLPGGKINHGESVQEGLCREILEELNLPLLPQDLHYFCHITAPAYGEKDGIIMEQDCFFAETKYQPVARAEINLLQYFTLNEYLGLENQAPGAISILKILKEANLID